MQDGSKNDRPSSGRKRPRYRSYIIHAQINGEIYEVFDISLTGAYISQAPDWFVQGQGLEFDFLIGNPPEEKVIPVEGRIVRIDQDGMGVIYRPPGPTWAKVLEKITSHET